MIIYDKLFVLMNEQGKIKAQLRNEKIIGQETLRKLKTGTGILEEYDYKIPGTNVKERRVRENSIDTKAIESLCEWLNCQPSDIMEVIPNTWENAERLCQILKCEKEELPMKVLMESKAKTMQNKKGVKNYRNRD